ncbi:MAG: recombinase family protein [Pseudomonadota bacterium]
MARFVTYKRLSKLEKGAGGLGLDAQQRDIDLFLAGVEGHEVVGAYTEVQSGGDNDRPKLAKAIALAKKHDAELLVAKLDRMSRNVAFIATLMEDKALRLRVASLPNADAFQLHLYAALAEQERKFISKRTTAALAQAKARGVKLGGLRDATMKRNAAARQSACDRAEKVRQIVMPLREQGASMRAIADALNAASVATARGGKWGPSSVKRTLDRLSA